MADPNESRPVRPPLSPLFAGAFSDAYPLCGEVPNAMAALLEALALRERAPPVPPVTDVRR